VRRLDRVLGPTRGWPWAYEKARPKHIRLKMGLTSITITSPTIQSQPALPLLPPTHPPL